MENILKTQHDLLKVQKMLLDILPQLEKKPHKVEIKPYREKRSLDANNYCWHLCEEIAKAVKSTSDEVYKSNIRAVGVYDIELMKIEANETFERRWATYGKGNIIERLGESLEHKGWEWVNVFHGSSTYDSKEMARFNDELVEKAKELDVDTKTPAELALLGGYDANSN